SDELGHLAMCPECGCICGRVMSGYSFVMGKREELYQGPTRRSERLMI
ncbi:hypothetical protein LCGC14_2776850, partial [marine sediment metagenome]